MLVSHLKLVRQLVFSIRDHNLQLVCGGSSTWTDLTNSVSAFADDSYTLSIKDGFDNGDILEWYLLLLRDYFMD